jgi:hypothetical protein
MGAPISSRRATKEPPVVIVDPRFDGWGPVSTFEDQGTAVACRDQLRTLGVDAACVADHALDRRGHGDFYVASRLASGRARTRSSRTYDCLLRQQEVSHALNAAGVCAPLTAHRGRVSAAAAVAHTGPRPDR